MNNSNLREETSGANQPRLCVVCDQFYGNPATQHMCSSCYKNSRGTPTSVSEPTQAEIQKVESIPPLDEVVTPIVEEVKQVEKKPEEPSKCNKCARKVGMMGYPCKCEKVHCKFHRLPEDHECDFDFKSLERAKLSTLNPVVAASKIERI